MTEYPFLQVDAFTGTPLGGNPCAVLLDTDDMDSATMLAIAREMNLSETAFVSQSDVADFTVRYFTPAEEIPLAGHPTIATTHALIDAGYLLLTSDYTPITLELQVGPINVDIFWQNGRLPRIVMQQPAPQFLSHHDPATVMPIFNLTPDDLLPNAPIQTVSTGTPQLMIPVRDHAALRRARVNIPAYTSYRTQSDFFSPHLFTLPGITDKAATFARHFGVPPDTMEDPFTGSATGGMAAYLWHHNLLTQSNFIAEQGHWQQRPGQATVERMGTAEAMTGVKVGGTAVTVLRGTFTL